MIIIVFLVSMIVRLRVLGYKYQVGGSGIYIPLYMYTCNILGLRHQAINARPEVLVYKYELV